MDYMSRLFACCGPRDPRQGRNSDSVDDIEASRWKENGQKVRSQNKDDYSKRLKRNEMELPILELAINQVECEYYETNPGPDMPRDYNKELQIMDKILRSQKRIA